MFDALLFDLDGTLIDTESVAMATGAGAFRALGMQVEPAFLHGLIGKDQASTRQIILAAHPGLDLTALNRFWAEGFQAATATSLPLKPFVLDLLAAAAHLPLGIVTSSGREEARRKLQVAGIAAHFRDVVSVDDVSRAKPSPEPYLLAAKRLGLPPQRCLVFEDSEVGAEAAHRAGCTVVQVPDILPASGLWAHHVAADLLSGARSAGLKV